MRFAYLVEPLVAQPSSFALYIAALTPAVPRGAVAFQLNDLRTSGIGLGLCGLRIQWGHWWRSCRVFHLHYCVNLGSTAEGGW